LTDGLSNCSEERVVVIVDVLGGCLLRVDDDSLSLIRLGVGVHSGFKAASNTWIPVDEVCEKVFADCFLYLVDSVDDILAISSSSAVLELHDMGRILVSKDLVWMTHCQIISLFFKY
jgi:hypothetical protein